jgi:hypothetical protein
MPVCTAGGLAYASKYKSINIFIIGSIRGLEALCLTDVRWGLFCILYIQPLEYMQPTSEDGTTLGCAAGRGSLSPACSVE